MQGMELSRRFYTEIVDPIIESYAPDLAYSAALIGPGSEVLGYDTEMSRDHDFGPRVILFIMDSDKEHTGAVTAMLDQQLPQIFNGFPVHKSMTVITTLEQFLMKHLAMDIHEPLELTDWLTFPSQSLLEMTRGEVFKDVTGQLSVLREQLRYYPDDIWLYLMASVWQRIGQEEHLMLRAGYVHDELGSSLIASRIVRDIMNLCFLIERQYAPYPKWFGTAFQTLQSSKLLAPCLMGVLTASTWRERERLLHEAYPYLAECHNKLGISDRIPEAASPFYERPFNVMKGEEIAGRIAEQIQDGALRELSRHRLIGGIDQLTDNTDFRNLCTWEGGQGRAARERLKGFYDPAQND